MKKEDIVLKQWKEEDASSLVSLLNNLKILNNLRDGIPYPYTLDDDKAFIHQTMHDNQYYWAITYQNQVIGSIGVFRQTNVHYRSAEMGYYLSEDYWGKGIMTMVVKEVCDDLFSHTDLIRIFAEPYSYNQGSCRVLEKAGFQCEGVLRQNAIKNGKVLDMKLYARIKEERILETERLYLRKMNDQDLDSLSRILQDEDTMYAYNGAFDDVETKQWLERQLMRYEQYGYGLWAVVLKENHQMIGQCGLTMQPWKEQELLEIGYLFLKEYWHHGYAIEAAKACKDYAFTVLDAKEVYSIIRDTNKASQNVAKRNGMKVIDQWVKHYRGIDMLHDLYCVKRG